MMTEKKMELEMQRIDLVAAVEAFNKKAALLGIDPIVIGAAVETKETSATVEEKESNANRLNKIFKDRTFYGYSDLSDALDRIDKGGNHFGDAGTLQDGTFWATQRKDGKYCLIFS